MESPKPLPILKQEQGSSVTAKKVDSFNPNYNDHTHVEDNMPKSSDDYFKKGNYKYSLKDYIGAINDFDKSIELNPQEAIYYNYRGVSEFELKDYHGAITDFTKAIELNPQKASNYNNRGVVKHRLGDYEGATYDYEQAIGIDSQSPNPYMWRGFTKYNQGDPESAILNYDKAINLNSQYADAYSKRCFAKYDLKDYYGAITDFVQAVAYKPGSSAIENIQELERVISETKSKLIFSQLPSFSDRQSGSLPSEVRVDITRHSFGVVTPTLSEIESSYYDYEDEEEQETFEDWFNSFDECSKHNILNMMDS